MNQAYAEYIWPSVYQDWIETSPLKDNPKINNSSKTSFWFYTADFSEERNQLEVRCIDSTHLLTRTRRKCCKGGLDGLSNTAWLKVAKSKTTFLSAVMVEEIVEPMSVSMAVTHFSESVENVMRQNGDASAADLCRDIRHWWKAEDDPGIPASDSQHAMEFKGKTTKSRRLRTFCTPNHARERLATAIVGSSHCKY
ncbi:MAG: hypothetical protein AB2693_32980 [Candidatus Thiodiazotropha sp.]